MGAVPYRTLPQELKAPPVYGLPSITRAARRLNRSKPPATDTSLMWSISRPPPPHVLLETPVTSAQTRITLEKKTFQIAAQAAISN